MQNRIVLHITHQFTRRLAYKLAFKRPSTFRKKALLEYKNSRKDFWWLVEKMDKGWFDSLPEGYDVYLGHGMYTRGYLPMFYLYYEKRKEL